MDVSTFRGGSPAPPADPGTPPPHPDDPGPPLPHPDDPDLWFAELYRRHRSMVFSAALRLTGSHADADDLASETFLRAFRAAAAYGAPRRADLRPRPWLAAILLNAWRNRHRSATRTPPPLLLDSPLDRPDPGEDVEAAAERRETGGELARLLALLPEKQRAAVVLRHVAGLSTAEISTALAAPEGTVKSYISRGLRRLRALTDLEEAPHAGPRT
ncbi:RNA polymerase sigma factor [Nocardiopsis trehalosi]|uniref:RNA polymerase sigma factor n=1 Tax=Nocardiopsis trehalosi TaxID=109329 RepID=UPI000A0544A6|nr:RNA polymerase sigma factor [Nocardiopsis trehalosi]